MCVCERERERERESKSECVCVRARERECVRERERERERAKAARTCAGETAGCRIRGGPVKEEGEVSLLQKTQGQEGGEKGSR